MLREKQKICDIGEKPLEHQLYIWVTICTIDYVPVYYYRIRVSVRYLTDTCCLYYSTTVSRIYCAKFELLFIKKLLQFSGCAEVN